MGRYVDEEGNLIFDEEMGVTYDDLKVRGTNDRFLKAEKLYTSDNTNIPALIEREVSNTLSNMRIVNSEDLIMLAKHSLLTGYITQSKAAELLGIPESLIRGLLNEHREEVYDDEKVGSPPGFEE